MIDNEKKVLVGITDNDELYFLNISTERYGKPHFSMNGETVRPILRSDAVEQCRSSIEDNDYLWRMAVQAEQTILGLDDWCNQVLENDELDGFDNSLFDIEVEVDREEWLFASSSCGQHEEYRIKHYFIDRLAFQNLMRAWKKYHLKDIRAAEVSLHGCGYTVQYLIDNLPVQNLEALAMQAITIIESEK